MRLFLEVAARKLPDALHRNKPVGDIRYDIRYMGLDRPLRQGRMAALSVLLLGLVALPVPAAAG